MHATIQKPIDEILEYIKPGERVQVFGDAKLTTALLDRLGHHSSLLSSSLHLCLL